MSRGKHWSKSDENNLIQGAGVYGINWFKKKTGDSYDPKDWPGAAKGRSTDAIYAKARELLGKGGLTRGSYSLTQICELTGYSRSQILRAREALAQKWKRTSAKGSYLVYEDQMLEIISWLRQDHWSKKHNLYSCLWCATDTRDHYQQGLCKRCFEKYAKRLKRLGMPVGSDALRKRLGDVSERLERQLSRGLALVGALWKEAFDGISESNTTGI